MRSGTGSPQRLGRLLLAACALSLLPCVAPADEVYRWVDEQGQLHFSNTPPPNGKAVQVEKPARPRINRVPLEGSAAVHRGAARVRPPASAAPERETIGGQGEAEWRARSEELGGRADAIRAELDSTRDGGEFYEARYRDGVRVGSENKSRRIERLEHELEAAEDVYDEFEDRARGADVPPGWLR